MSTDLTANLAALREVNPTLPPPLPPLPQKIIEWAQKDLARLNIPLTKARAMPSYDYKKILNCTLLGLFAIASISTFLSFVLPDLSVLHQHNLFGAAIISGIALAALGGLIIKKSQDSKPLFALGAALALVGAFAVICGFHAGFDLAFQNSPLGLGPHLWLGAIFGVSVIGLASSVYVAHKAKYIHVGGLS